uniref:Secreted protein n=1 Tax=Mesocestoides corti TaxID=53468 RepID=A0A5K3EVF2_MESCO
TPPPHPLPPGVTSSRRRRIPPSGRNANAPPLLLLLPLLLMQQQPTNAKADLQSQPDKTMQFQMVIRHTQRRRRLHEYFMTNVVV